jgi:DNA topoisomerase-3
MKQLIIAEKPKVARAIAAILGRGEDKNGYIVVGDTVVSYCFGHLLEQANPREYNAEWARWSDKHLPYVITNWKLNPIPKSKEQFEVLRKLIAKAEVIVNAGDPDREGQLLVDEVLFYCGWQGPTKRVLINATDPGTIKKALAKLEDNQKYYPLYQAALCRQRADWLVGMNLTVAATKLIAGDELTSIGRVQTPTLGLVVQRDLEIANFVSKTFYTLAATVRVGANQVVLTHAPADDMRILEKSVAENIAMALRGSAQTLAVETSEGRELSPLPFMLPTFQVAAEEELGLGAKASLDVLQKLYESQYVSYPRSDCEYLPPEQKGDALRIAQQLYDRAEEFTNFAAASERMEPKNRVYNGAKVAEHHGIVPTGRIPGQDVPPNLRKAWELVARRFLLSLMPDYRFEETEMAFVFDGRKFSVKGQIPLNLAESWRAFAPRKKDDAQPLPVIEDGSIGQVTEVDVKTGKTTPPKPYTEATLIADMRSIAKYVKDERLKSILKSTSGIGTAATQAATIETLKERGYVEIKAKKVLSTPFGRDLIECLPPQLYDPGITALWEDALEKIAKGEHSPDEFMRRIDVYVERRIMDLRSTNKQMSVKSPVAKKSTGAQTAKPKKSSATPVKRRS